MEFVWRVEIDTILFSSSFLIHSSIQKAFRALPKFIICSIELNLLLGLLTTACNCNCTGRPDMSSRRLGAGRCVQFYPIFNCCWRLGCGGILFFDATCMSVHGVQQQCKSVDVGKCWCCNNNNIKSQLRVELLRKELGKGNTQQRIYFVKTEVSSSSSSFTDLCYATDMRCDAIYSNYRILLLSMRKLIANTKSQCLWIGMATKRKESLTLAVNCQLVGDGFCYFRQCHSVIDLIRIN